MSYKNTLIGRLPVLGQVIFYGAVAFLLYKLYKYITVTAPQHKNYQTAVDNAQTELTNLSSQGVKPSLSEADFNGMANSLEQAFTGCGTGFSTIIKPMFEKFQNDADIYALISKYGVRTIDECAWGTFNGDLSSTLTYKLTGFTFCALNDLGCTGSISELNDVLKKNGIKYRFA